MDASEHGLPRRREDLLVERVDDELIVLDEGSGHAHCLTGLAAAIWSRCDGSHDVVRLAERSGATTERVEAALAELRELELLEPAADEPHGLTRRVIAKRAVQAGAGALVLSAALPTVASAASKIATGQAAPKCSATTPGGAAVADSECASGYCYYPHTGTTKYCAPSATCVRYGGVCVIGLIACCYGACSGTIALTCAQ